MDIDSLNIEDFLAIGVIFFATDFVRTLQDPKRKVHKSIKGVLKLEVEKLHTSLVDVDNISDGGNIIIDSNDDVRGHQADQILIVKAQKD
ncbi:guanine nucleotide exchange factor SPIKE 1-like isoform X2 [Zingiber officinale]|uniref:guanine nucleotide exchange factor SPIKE 1-like isoform X2 n=1 Tax=Zingiber officinale TaxID=94328 RepID=UPI001C4B04E2|nr:guanine nucleotide exchange factor SPIKE 1-like isoform X2 [Zingiber officinale]